MPRARSRWWDHHAPDLTDERLIIELCRISEYQAENRARYEPFNEHNHFDFQGLPTGRWLLDRFEFFDALATARSYDPDPEPVIYHGTLYCGHGVTVDLDGAPTPQRTWEVVAEVTVTRELL